MESGERKRVRVSQACDQCRRRKDRCDSGRPKCKPCCKAGRSCTYNPSTKKRGLPTGYVRAIETLLGLVFCSVDGCEAILQQLLRGELENGDTRCSAAITGRDSAASETLLDAWRKSSVVKEVDRLLIAAEALDAEGSSREPLDNDFLDTNASDEHGTTESHDLKLPQFKLVSQLTTDRPLLLVSQAEGPRDPIVTAPRNLSPPIGAAPSLARLQPDIPPGKLPSNWSQLLDIHFANTHAWFPISHKQDLLRPAYLLAQNPSIDLANLTSGEGAFLWAALAFSSYQLEKSFNGLEHTHTPKTSELTSIQLSSNATFLLSQKPEVYDIGHLRALMLLTLIQVDCGFWTAAWSLVGRAIYVAVDLGMPASPKEDLSKQAGAVLDEGRRRAFLGCFALDTLISTRLGRRPYLRHYDLHSIGAVHTDGIEEWEAWRASELCVGIGAQGIPHHSYTPGHVLSIFNHFVNLLGLLNDSLCVKGHSAETNLSAIAQSYDRWKSLLPPHCRLPDSATTLVQNQSSIQLLNLNLASECLHTILGKKTLRENDSSRQDLNKSTSYTQLKSVITEHISKFGHAWIPPTFNTYVFCCGDTLLLQKISISNTEAPGSQRDVGDLTEITISDSNNNTALWATRQSFRNSDTLFTFDPNVLSPVSQTKSSAASKLQTETTLRYSESQHVIESLLGFPTDLREGFILEDPIMSLPEENGEDNLFDRLAMLDPIDWSAAQPEFMRNLGLTSTSTPNQFQSLFNLDTI